MSKMDPNQLRQKYLNFYKKHDHQIIPSAPLVPENDPTTLFTSSGMQPLMPYFLGQPHPKGQRVVDSQKCFRAVDIDEVGDNRHTTFFEMLGNWSFGDYFKKEQIPWVFEFLTKEVGLDPQKLFVTAYKGDDKIGVPKDIDTPRIWQEIFSLVKVEAEIVEDPESEGLAGRIYYYGDSNWWSRSGAPASMPAGEPGGPDSEIFYDFGSELQLHENSVWKDEKCHPNCDCGRFLEIGNSVFMQYVKVEAPSTSPSTGAQDSLGMTFKELPAKNVDFGGGLERIMAAVNNDPDVFKTGFFLPIIEKIEQLSGKKYADYQLAFRVIADHVKAATMLAGDGVYPGNKEQAYFSRRLLRRAIRYGQQLGIQDLFLSKLVPVITKMYKQQYPEVSSQLSVIRDQFTVEEKKFRKTLEKGLREFEKILETKSPSNSAGRQKLEANKLTAEVAFKLYETYGFPLELSIEEAENRGVGLENNIREEFEKIRIQHSKNSRTASAGKFKGGLADQSENTIKYHTATHLLHAALRQVLGDSVGQKGSNITGERMRFDFSFDRAMTEEEKKEVEELVNQWIKEDLPVTRQELSKQEALDSGAVAFFIEKYPDIVSMYTIGFDTDGSKPEFDLAKKTGWISRELCGGPHVTQTGEIGNIKLTKEKSASAGVRRVYMELRK